MRAPLRSLYVCYLSLEDPLVQTQVVAYLEGLAESGHTIHLLTFDPKLPRERRRALTADMSRRGIEWRSLRYHKRPSLPATVYDVLVGALVSTWLVRRHALDAIHARNHVAAALALIAKRLTGCGLIFDIRGLMAEQYVDAGSWRRGGAPYRITEWIQTAAIRKAEATIVLTEAARVHLFGPAPAASVHVIPCCAEVDRSIGDGEERAVRAELGIGDRPVMAYVGKLSGRYMRQEMVDFFAVARRLRSGLFFLVMTQEPAELVEAELTRAGISSQDYRVLQVDPDQVVRYLTTAEFGVFLYRPGASDVAVSPTKIGEYLAAGLPIASVAGIGDTEALLRDHEVGVVVTEFSEEAYDTAARELLAMGADPTCRERCREVARNNFSLRKIGIPRYERVYREVAG